MKKVNLILNAAILTIVGSRAAAQSPDQSPVDHMAFDRPEAWALKYFTAVSTFTTLGPPRIRKPGSIDFGLELGWVPELDLSKRRVGFDGTAVEDLNKTPLLGRPRLIMGLPGGISAEVGWVPPVGLHGGRANLVAAALERPFYDGARWVLGLRAYGQLGHAKGDYTCPDKVASLPPDSPDNPLGCNERSRDVATLNNIGAALTGGVKLGRASALHFASGATYHDVQFQVGALTNGVPDHTLLVTHGWTGWVASGASFPLGGRASAALEAFYSPLIVKRPPRETTQNDGLFNVRAMLRYEIR